MRTLTELGARSPEHRYLAHAVRHMRARQAISRRRLARAARIRRRDLARLEWGRLDPSVAQVLRLGAVLGGLQVLALQVENAAYVHEIGGARNLRFEPSLAGMRAMAWLSRALLPLLR